MAIKSIHFLLILSLVIVLSLFPSADVRAMAGESSSEEFPSLEQFIRQVGNGKTGELRGIYIPNTLAAPIVQHPDDMKGFVSPWENVMTQFRLASKLGSTGLLAHNYLAGETFAFLQKGQEIYLINGDGQVTTFVVTNVLRYQALEPRSPFSHFVDLDTHESINYTSLFSEIYNRPGNVILQTCIQAGSELSWGRLFVIAEPLPE